MTFLEHLKTLLDKNAIKMRRSVNGDIVMLNDFVRYFVQGVQQKDCVVIPIGKLKPEAKKPYAVDPTSNAFVDVNSDLYDVNFFAFHKSRNIAMLTTNREGPGWRTIENYFNTFLFPAELNNCRVRLRPISMLNDLDKIQTAESVRDIHITLDLGRPLDNFFAGSHNLKDEHSLLKGLRGIYAMGKVSKEALQSDILTFKLGYDKTSRRAASLDLEALIEMLDFINLEASCIKEIEVRYKDGTSKYETARLRNSEFDSDIIFPSTARYRMAGEYIANNMDDVLRNNITRFRSQIGTYFQNQTQMGDDYAIQEEFDGSTPLA